MKKGCLILDLDVPIWKDLWQKFDTNDVVTGEYSQSGRPTVPHCTILYGFEDEVNHLDVQMCLPSILSFSIEPVKLAVFENEDDVLHLKLKDESLNIVFDRLKSMFPVELTFPEYKPHMTLAHLKSGRGKEYQKKLSGLEWPNPILATNYRFSYANGNEVTF